MIILKSQKEIELMRRAGRITAEALAAGGEAVKPGVTTAHINDVIEKYIKSKGGKPSFKGYGGFPAAACISINEKVIHGIPSHETVIADGDIVSIDVGAFIGGFHGDTAATFAAGNVSAEAQKLIDVTKQCFYEGIAYATAGNRLGDIGAAVSDYAHKNGFTVVYDYVGHGIGTHLHEDPSVPNYGVRGKGVRLQKGMTIAVEPMINQGVPDVKVLKDDWTVVTKDGKLSAHYEHTIAITDGEPLILTSL
ncbi:MAG: type I methionyl aminopeptidase [Clostridiales bacterium]|nr:MAG: type I methionyl aminopeptidase [Clostridiales bacterium]